MSKVWKWILGILAVLVVVAILAGAFWFWQYRSQMMASHRTYASQPNPQAAPGVPNTTPNGQDQPLGPQGFGGDRRFPMGGWGFRGPMMGGRHFSQFGPVMPFGMGFFFLGGLFRLIIPLAVLALVAILFYQLGKRSGLSQAAPAKVSASAPSPAPATGQQPANKKK